jgi:sigma-B regulation protein RsbU (phosphoserine phosphatase)
MSNLQASVRAFAGSQSRPGNVAASVNRALCSNPALRTFATFFYAVVDCASRTIAFTNAGHNPPILVRADGSVERLSTGGIVLGVFEDAAYDQREIALRTGDRLVLFTDGLTEAENAEGIDFGDERLVETIVAHRHEAAETVRDTIFRRVRQFTGGAFADDATLISIAIN